jgi:predicted transcriptional regulator
MEHRPPLGEQELDTLRFVAERAPISVGEAAKQYGAQRGLARTTVMTVMERLRVKGYLSRSRVKGVFVYRPKTDHEDVLKTVVAQFVERSLGGSLSPFVAYLADTGKLTAVQLAELQAIADSLDEAGETK